MKDGTLVRDRWFPQWGYGRIRKVSASRWEVAFKPEPVRYDRAHLQFLSPVKKHRSGSDTAQ